MESATVTRSPNGQFRLEDVIPRARSLIKGTKRQAVTLFVVYFVVLMAISTFGVLTAAPDGRFPLALDVALALAATPFTLASATLGLQRAAGRPANFGALFKFGERLPLAMLVYVPVYLVQAQVGPSLGLVGAFLLAVVLAPTLFVAHFMVDRNLGPVQAVSRSYRLALRNVGQLVLFWLLMVALGLLCALTLGIGLIWLLPFAVIVNAVMYQEAEGLARDDVA